MVAVVATDADDPTYGNSAQLTYSILQGQPYFSVEPKTGEATGTNVPLRWGAGSGHGGGVCGLKGAGSVGVRPWGCGH